MSPILPALYGAATLLVNSTIWIFGANGNSTTNGLITIDVSGSWSTSSPPISSFSSNANSLSPRSFSSMALGSDGSSLWIYGGRSDISDLTDTSQFAVFDTKNKTWSDAQKQNLLANSPNPPPVFAQSVVGDSKGVAYYYGGSNDLWNMDSSSFEDGPGLRRLDTSNGNFTSMSQTPGAPGALAWHTATLVNGTFMYVIGGVNPTPVDDFPVTVYNTAADKWSPPIKSAVRPSARHGHTAVLSTDNSQIIVFGGMVNSTTYLNDVWTLNLATNQWMRRNTTGNAPSGRAFHSSAMVKNQMIVMFGYSQNAFNTVYVLDTTTWTWTTSFGSSSPQPSTTATGPQSSDTSSLDNTIAKIPISPAGIAGIVLAGIAVVSIVMLSVIQPRNRVKPI